MNRESIEEILKSIGSEDVPEDVHQIAEQTSEEFSKTLTPSRQHILWEYIMKSRITKLAAAAVIIIAVLIGIHQFGGSIDSSSVAFADVVERLRNARTLTYTMTTHTQIEGMPTMRMEMAFKEPGYMRISGKGGIVSIMDQMKKKGLVINPIKKEFIEIDFVNLPPDQAQIQLIEHLRTLPDRADENLGEKEINGQILQGFRITEEDGLDKTVWVDAETGELVRVEIEFANAPGMHAVMTDFQFNVNLDDVLFSLTPPEGYTRQKIRLEAGEITEQDLVKLLRLWVRQTKDHLFPPTINPMGLAKAGMKMQKAGKFLEEHEIKEEGMQRSLQMTRGLMFVMQMKPENDWHYAGKDVKFGGADTPIFWYRPKDSETYRVIYGDLSVKDVAPENLPE